MCKVTFNTCYHCSKLRHARLEHCTPVSRLLNAPFPSEWDIYGAFFWSPLDGCDGIEIDPLTQRPSAHRENWLCNECHEDDGLSAQHARRRSSAGQAQLEEEYEIEIETLYTSPVSPVHGSLVRPSAFSQL